MIFEADCVNSQVNGIGTLTVLNSKKVISKCVFEKGEIVEDAILIGILTDNIYRKAYKKGSYTAISQIETDKDGNKIEIDKKLTFKETYETLLNPYEILNQNKKAKETYIKNMSRAGTLFSNPLILEPLDMILNYFSEIRDQTPIKKYTKNNFEVSEFNYNDFKIVFNSYNEGVSNNYALIIECYDKYGRLIIVRCEHVSYEAIAGLNSPEHLTFFDKVGYGYNLTTYMYDNKGNIKKASKYNGVSENDIDSMCDYSDFTDDVLSLPNSKPMSIIR